MALAQTGLGGVAVDPLARQLGATKGSFYWHFSDRDELIAATLGLWEQRHTTDVIVAIDAIADPRRRIDALARFAYERAARGNNPQAGVLAAASDARVAPVLERVTATRLVFLEHLYTEIGVEPGAARRHARLAYALYVGIVDLRRAAPALELELEPDLDDQIELMILALSHTEQHGSVRSTQTGSGYTEVSSKTSS